LIFQLYQEFENSYNVNGEIVNTYCFDIDSYASIGEHRYFPGNFNGDGLTDFLKYEFHFSSPFTNWIVNEAYITKVVLMINNGNGFDEIDITYNNPFANNDPLKEDILY